MSENHLHCKGFSQFINKKYKNVRIICIAKDSHILSTKNNSAFIIFMFEISNIVNFEQLGPGYVIDDNVNVVLSEIQKR